MLFLVSVKLVNNFEVKFKFGSIKETAEKLPGGLLAMTLVAFSPWLWWLFHGSWLAEMRSHQPQLNSADLHLPCSNSPLPQELEAYFLTLLLCWVECFISHRHYLWSP